VSWLPDPSVCMSAPVKYGQVGGLSMVRDRGLVRGSARRLVTSGPPGLAAPGPAAASPVPVRPRFAADMFIGGGLIVLIIVIILIVLLVRR
jgi:hypothetical protein